MVVIAPLETMGYPLHFLRLTHCFVMICLVGLFFSCVLLNCTICRQVRRHQERQQEGIMREYSGGEDTIGCIFMSMFRTMATPTGWHMSTSKLRRQSKKVATRKATQYIVSVQCYWSQCFFSFVYCSKSYFLGYSSFPLD